MGLLDRPFQKTLSLLEALSQQGETATCDLAEVSDWPIESSLILEEDTAVELGNPKTGSLSLLLWSETLPIADNAIRLFGPDLDQLEGRSAPFAQIVLVNGKFADDYDVYRDLRNTVYDTHVSGLMARTLPSRQTLWCRVGKQALQEGLRLSHLGATLIRNLKTNTSAAAVSVNFITLQNGHWPELLSVANETSRLIGALLKVYEEPDHECETCDYWDVCESVEELRKIRKQKTKGLPT